MTSKKRSVLFERNPSANNAETSDPEPSSRSGIHPVVRDEEAAARGARTTKDAAAPDTSLDAKALEVLVTAHVLSRL